MRNSSLKRSGMAGVNEGSHRFTCHPHVYPQAEWTVPAFTPQPQSATLLWSLLSRLGQKAELTWVAGYKVTWFTRPQTVTNPSTYRARC